MEKQIPLEGVITFGQAVKLYCQIICTDRGLLSLHHFNARNRSEGISAQTNFPGKQYLEITVSEDVKEADTVMSGNALMANAPFTMYWRESGRWALDDITNVPIDWMLAYKEPERLLRVKVPFVHPIEIRMQKQGRIYETRLAAGTMKDVRLIEEMLRHILGKNAAAYAGNGAKL